jgi:hypothetical protein
MNYLSEFRGSNMKYLIETGNWKSSARNDTVFSFVGRILELFHDLVINTTGATNFMCNAL